ncbi:MAG: hypothetical protein IJ640_09320 [Prevotella sp.]|nr:hypothetical protein [Prevotella sp.]
MSKTGAAFSVRFLRNGDQITIVRNIIKQNGDGAALFQVVDPNSGAVSPNWGTGHEADQPIIQIGARSSAGYPVEITDVFWAFDGTTLNFTYNGSTWVTAANDSRFKARINGDKYELRVAGNIASSSVVSNKQISYEVHYVSNAMTDTTRGDVDVLIQQSGTDSHILQITTDRVELDEQHPNATLTAVAQYGVANVAIGSNGYSISWYQDNVLLTGQNGATLAVTRAMVSGGSIFVAKLIHDGNVVAQDGQRINDIADEYQIAYEPTNAGSNYVGLNHNATYTLSMTRNKVAYTGAVSYSWQIFDALGNTKTAGTGSTVTVTPSDCLLSNGNYADVDVQVTADF